jgi:hypothetical protein
LKTFKNVSSSQGDERGGLKQTEENEDEDIFRKYVRLKQLFYYSHT